MIYRKGFGSGGTNMDADSGNLYRNNVTSAVNWRGTAGIMPGLGPYLQDNASTAYNNVMAQLNFARDQGGNGVQIFSYTDLLGGNAVDAEVRRAWLDFLAANNAAPPVASVTDFETDEGYFPTAITFSGSNVNVAPTSTADRTTEDAHGGAASQRLTINKAGAGTFLARHLSGTGTGGGAPASNIEFPSVGAVGFWLKTTARDVEIAPAVDDNTANTSTERGYFQNVIADGQWHFYEWMLNDPTHWDAWAGTGADGTVESRFTLDSIQFRGSEDVNVLLLDDVVFDATAVAADQWTLDTSININSPDTNWRNSANWQGGVPNAPGAVANFLRRASSAQTVTVDGPVTVGHVTFDNSNSYTLAGPGTITMDVTSGNASLTVRNRGTHHISAPVAFADDTTFNVDHKAALHLTGALDNTAGKALTKSGDGTLELSGPQTHGAGASFTATAGTTNFNTNAGMPTSRTLAIAASGPGTRVNLNTTQHLAAVNVSGGATIGIAPGGQWTVTASSVNVGGGGRFDLADNVFVIDYDGASPADDVRSMIGAAHAGGAWTGDGITSTSADANHGLGFTEQDDTSIVVTLARYGDADLSGNVNLNDFNRLASNFGSTAAIWSEGDFNYDGSVNLTDFNLLAGNFGLAAAGTSVTSQEWAALAAAVPEPAHGGGVVAAASVAALRRRRRAS
jgi:autotransporter-associated beta strand protein